MNETGSNTTMTRSRGRSRIGKRCFDSAPKSRSVNLTVVGAIALDGVRAMKAYEGGTTYEAFLKFVREALAPSLRPGDVVAMDNLRILHNEDVKAAIRATGADVIYLPPYSPELNPIELAWSKLKACLRAQKARSLRALSAALAKTSTLLAPSDSHGWYRHCGYANHHK